MNFFTYRHECRQCGNNFTATYLKKFKQPRKYKTCPACSKSEVVVEDLGGLKGRGKCGDCKHFNPIDKRGPLTWGHCGLGHELAEEGEYTLTWAIDNEVGCQVSFEEHESYGNDVLGLVYSEDYCIEFEEGDE